MKRVPGYTYGSPVVPRAPITLEELGRIEEAILLGPADLAVLRRAHEVLKDQIEEIVEVWYEFIESKPFLIEAFSDPEGRPIRRYLSRVRARFGQWILDTTRAEYDQQWLDYQFEIGRRHHRVKKNRTDYVRAAEIVPFRYMVALTYPVFWTVRPFLARKGATAQEVEEMHQAWLKSVLLQVILWSYPYVKHGDF